MKSKIYSCIRVGILSILFYIAAGTQAVTAQQFLTKIDGWNAYVHLPDDYNDSVNKRYPLIVFIPGLGEVGTDANKLLIYGPSKYVAEGHKMQFMVNGILEKPIVISLQPSSAWPGAATINRKLDSVFARYRCDLQRIHATGLSMGGWSWNNFVDNYSPVYNKKLTSIVSMSPPPPDNTIGNMKHFALAGGTMWGIEGNNDLRGLDDIRDTMNKAVPGSARYTLYIGGHCCWNNYYTPSFTENGESIYTWMLKQKRALINGNTLSPEANAGKDSSTSNVLPSVPLKGVGNDPNGLPINFNWLKIAGPSGGTIANTSSMQTTVSGLGMGEYKFELRVTNAMGLIGKDTVILRNGLAVLPVILQQFTGKTTEDGSVQLNWKTSSEINSNYFEVERSKDAQNYTALGKVLASGSLSNGMAYNYMDYLPENGDNFYRLKMVDIDGSFEYSKVVKITTSHNKAGTMAIASAYKNGGNIQMNISSSEATKVTLRVVDANGKILFNNTMSLNKGMNVVSKNLMPATGVYHVSVLTEKEKITKSFIYK